jgi:hypothetical protein
MDTESLLREKQIRIETLTRENEDLLKIIEIKSQLIEDIVKLFYEK